MPVIRKKKKKRKMNAVKQHHLHANGNGIPPDIEEAVGSLPPFATLDHVADLLHCDRRTVQRWVAAGRLSQVKATPGGSSRALFTRGAVAEFLSQR